MISPVFEAKEWLILIRQGKPLLIFEVMQKLQRKSSNFKNVKLLALSKTRCCPCLISGEGAYTLKKCFFTDLPACVSGRRKAEPHSPAHRRRVPAHKPRPVRLPDHV